MSERSRPSSRDQVLNVVRSKAWYGLDPHTGAFNWENSLSNIARDLKISANDAGRAFTTAFTPDCLSKVNINFVDVPLLKALHKINKTPHIWTVGDEKWQKIKFEKSGAAYYVPEDHFHCSSSNKIEKLKTIVDNLSKRTKQIIVADDKADNVREIQILADVYSKKGINIGNFYMNLSNSQADGTAFYRWLLPHLAQDRNLELILDFDGVVANTDAVLLGPAVDNLWSLIENH